jgi:mono/diheme cytochrome c family protein
MTRRLILNAALALLLLGLVAFNWIAMPDVARPNFEFLPQMAHAPRYNTFSANPNFADGKTLQTPVANTIARGELPLHYVGIPADAIRAGNELVSPVSASDTQARTRGEHVFNSFCVPCHGPNATGTGTVTQRGVPPPPSLLAQHAVAMKDGQLFHILTYGQNNMASYAGQISRADRWDVIAYVRSLQAASVPALTTPVTPPATPAATPAGRQSTAARGAQ